MSLAYQAKDGVGELTFTRLDANPSERGAGCAVSADEHLVIPGASQPDWGPADPPAARYAPPPSAGAKLTAGGAATQRFRGKLSVSCTATAAGTCRAMATVKVGNRRYASKPATAKVAGGRATTLTPAFGKTATKAIRTALRHTRLTAIVTLTAGGSTTTRTVTLKR
ncbi:MAG: hypothetical protein QOF86_1042 [Baekduia sp.]|nr:hypothetical protein [Baekduia sp.]